MTRTTKQPKVCLACRLKQWSLCCLFLKLQRVFYSSITPSCLVHCARSPQNSFNGAILEQRNNGYQCQFVFITLVTGDIPINTQYPFLHWQENVMIAKCSNGIQGELGCSLKRIPEPYKFPR